MLAVVPARGGSKGLPGKNLLPLGGRPLIHHSLAVAAAAAAIDRVLVTTDDPEIRLAALEIPGVEAPFLRPDALATDDAGAVDVYLHAVDWLKQHENCEVNEICVLLPTAPLRLASDIDGAIALYRERQADVVVSVSAAKPLPWHQDMAADGRLVEIVDSPDGAAIANRQCMGRPPVVLNGSIYVLRIGPLRETRAYFGDRTYGYPMPASRSVDIDDADDFAIAEALMAARGAS